MRRRKAKLTQRYAFYDLPYLLQEKNDGINAKQGANECGALQPLQQCDQSLSCRSVVEQWMASNTGGGGTNQ
jgi:hypothetical protein